MAKPGDRPEARRTGTEGRASTEKRLSAEEPTTAAPPAKRKRRWLLPAGVVVLLGAAAAAIWLRGAPVWVPFLHTTPAKAAEAVPAPPVYADMPEIVANLNGGPHGPHYVKLHVKLELSKPADRAAVAQAMPRLMDLFTTYLRETRPEELRGAEGLYRLRAELIARASLAAAPAHIKDVLFTEMLVQ